MEGVECQIASDGPSPSVNEIDDRIDFPLNPGAMSSTAALWAL